MFEGIGLKKRWGLRKMVPVVGWKRDVEKKN